MINKKKLAFGLSRLIKRLLMLLVLNTVLLATAEYTNINALGPWLKANVIFSLSILPAPASAPQGGTSNPKSPAPEPAPSEASVPSVSSPAPSNPVTSTPTESAPTPTEALPSPSTAQPSEPLPPAPAPIAPEPVPPVEPSPTPVAIPTATEPAARPQAISNAETFPIASAPSVTQTPAESPVAPVQTPAPQGWLTKILVTSQFVLSFTVMAATATLYLII